MSYGRKKVRSHRSDHAHEFELIIECKGTEKFGGLQVLHKV